MCILNAKMSFPLAFAHFVLMKANKYSFSWFFFFTFQFHVWSLVKAHKINMSVGRTESFKYQIIKIKMSIEPNRIFYDII